MLSLGQKQTREELCRRGICKMDRLIKESLFSYRRYVLKDPFLSLGGIPGVDDYRWEWDEKTMKAIRGKKLEKETAGR